MFRSSVRKQRYPNLIGSINHVGALVGRCNSSFITINAVRKQVRLGLVIVLFRSEVYRLRPWIEFPWLCPLRYVAMAGMLTDRFPEGNSWGFSTLVMFIKQKLQWCNGDLSGLLLKGWFKFQFSDLVEMGGSGMAAACSKQYCESLPYSLN